MIGHSSGLPSQFAYSRVHVNRHIFYSTEIKTDVTSSVNIFYQYLFSCHMYLKRNNPAGYSDCESTTL